MAKSLLNKGLLKVHVYQSVENTLTEIYSFIDKYREKTSRLSSFILCFDDNLSFEEFETLFWKTIKSMNDIDKIFFKHDERVSSDVHSSEFSFSLKSEAFFILVLHPDSPRWARRFFKPAIVFNPHQQFEKLRAKGLFSRIREIIRNRDTLLQGTINPMLSDFGDRSEIYQYMGKIYHPHETLSL